MRSRGFTLAELMLTVSLVGVVAAAGGLLFLEARIAGARVEAQVGLQREASLITEIVGRDLRAARRIEMVEGDLQLWLSEESGIFYVLGEQGLVRQVGDEKWIVGRHVSSLAASQEETAYVAKLELERHFIKGRRYRIRRDIRVGRRQ